MRLWFPTKAKSPSYSVVSAQRHYKSKINIFPKHQDHSKIQTVSLKLDFSLLNIVREHVCVSDRICLLEIYNV